MVDGFDFEEAEEAIITEDLGKAPFEEVVKEKKEVKKEVAVQEPVETGVSVSTFKFDGIEGIETAVVGETGTTASIFPIERVTFSKDRKQMLAVLTSQVIIVKQHYHEEIGKVLCNQKDCCDMLGLPHLRYVYPVAVYDCDKNGKPITQNIELKVMILGKDAYETIKTIHDVNGDLSSVDIVVTCTDEKYQKCSYITAGPTRWIKSPAIKATIMEKWSSCKKHLLLPMGRIMDKEEILRRFEQKEGEGTSHEKDRSPAKGKESFEDVKWD